MNITLPLDKMTIAEKIQTMETLWDDLCHNSQKDIPSPAWHKKILSERENEVKAGKAHFIDWEQAKKEIKDSIE